MSGQVYIVTVEDLKTDNLDWDVTNDGTVPLEDVVLYINNMQMTPLQTGGISGMHIRSGSLLIEHKF